MQKDYMNGLSEACKKGLTPQEVQVLMRGLLRKSNTKQGGDMLISFATGIGATKKHSLIQQQKAQLQSEVQNTQEKSRQYIYNQNIDL